MDELFLSDTEVMANTSSTNIASKKGRQTEDAPANPTTEAQSARAVHPADVATQTLDNSEDAEYRKPIQAETTARETDNAGSRTLSWRCRSCLRDICVEPVATACGHIFCLRCIMKEFEANGACPACKKLFLVKLDVVL
ncbi:hypothetical protein PYCCODRAFT_11610 [Trametes coccinea BRFM310]|uniref:RING-type domain-containing protein n=1 Tax=Trametes coccinea (strain BRFM310) TaxID=1353009 RepID=A0A1Y2J4K0_TRAC3|nr:hypothetical protein PYCCODRAFT_11610 [Trametes coccinea BRFM310]